MKLSVCFAIALVSIAPSASRHEFKPADAADTRIPVMVELFTSEFLQLPTS
jgi:hypothetical protein